MDTRDLPAQPEEKDWAFIRELQSPLWGRHAWAGRDARDGEVEFAGGVRIVEGFEDPEGLLRAAYGDLRNFLRARNVPMDGPFAMETRRGDTDVPEAYRIEVSPEGCRILAGDAEGIRRGLFYVEDEMLRAEGPFLRLGVQFRSGHNIYRFYGLRERMLRMDGLERLDLLAEMEAIVRAELANDEELLPLCEQDSRLGFHSEAEGYKYFSAKIRWRMDQLRRVLAEDFPAFERAVQNGDLLHAEYTGRRITGASVACRRMGGMAGHWRRPQEGFPPGVDVRSCEVKSGGTGRETAWAVCRDDEALYLFVRCTEPDMATLKRLEDAQDFGADRIPGRNCVVLKLEPRRLWPCKRFAATAGGGRSTAETFEVKTAWAVDAWWCAMRIPFETIEADPDDLWPVRIDVQRTAPGEQTGGSGVVHCWMAQHPWTPRLALGTDNPADLGWLVFG